MQPTIFVGDALVADQAEAVVDHLAGHVDQGLDADRHLAPGSNFGCAVPAFLAMKESTPSAATTTGARNSPLSRSIVTPTTLPFFEDHVIDGGAGDQGGTGLDRLFGEPVVEAGAEDGVAVVRGAIEVAGVDADVEVAPRRS